MTKLLSAVLAAMFACTLTACGGGSKSSSATSSTASNRSAISVTSATTGISEDGVCNGNPDAGAVGDMSGVVDSDNSATYYGAKSTLSDHGGTKAGNAVVDCVMTLHFGSTLTSADYANITGTVKGTWHDDYSEFYFYQYLHAIADVYTLDINGNKTLLTSQEEQIEPHCIGETVENTHTTECPFTVSAGNVTSKLDPSVAGVEFDIHFYTITSTSTCFTSCTNTLEPHITGTQVVKSGVEVLASGT